MLRSMFVLLLGLGLVPRMSSASPTLISSVKRLVPACPTGVRHCIGLRIHLAQANGRPFYSISQLKQQLQEAQQQFRSVGVGFRIVEVGLIGPLYRRVDGANQRDRLGRFAKGRGLIDVFFIGNLVDLSKKHEIRGVHWRLRSNRRRTWVIMGTKFPCPSWLLAHELGHFFGLPHSRYPASIMNKRFRIFPLPTSWRFVSKERQRITRTLRRFLRKRRLIHHTHQFPF